MRDRGIFERRKMRNEDISAARTLPEKLYHGTCKAFIAYALQNKGRFGSECDGVSLTPILEHARVFAESWKSQRGLARLRDYFLDSIDGALSELSEPVILEFNARLLGRLKYRLDCGEDEYYVKGQVDINKATLVECALEKFLEDGK